jgi:hypothetical protein
VGHNPRFFLSEIGVDIAADGFYNGVGFDEGLPFLAEIGLGESLR